MVGFDEYGPVRMIRTADWKYVHRYPYGPNELYNLADDPGENENLYEYGVSASGEPSAESRYGRIIREMRARMEDWFLRYADPATDGCRSNVTGLGQVDFCDTRRTWPQSFVGPVDVELARVEDD